MSNSVCPRKNSEPSPSCVGDLRASAPPRRWRRHGSHLLRRRLPGVGGHQLRRLLGGIAGRSPGVPPAAAVQVVSSGGVPANVPAVAPVSRRWPQWCPGLCPGVAPGGVSACAWSGVPAESRPLTRPRLRSLVFSRRYPSWCPGQYHGCCPAGIAASLQVRVCVWPFG